jgi:hypothetical protein
VAGGQLLDDKSRTLVWQGINSSNIFQQIHFILISDRLPNVSIIELGYGIIGIHGLFLPISWGVVEKAVFECFPIAPNFKFFYRPIF